MPIPEGDALYIETIARQVGELYSERHLPGAHGIPAMVEGALRSMVDRAETRAVADALAVLEPLQMTLADL